LERLPDRSDDSERETPPIGADRLVTELFDEKLDACFRTIGAGLLSRSVGISIVSAGVTEY
jgi:hypothetical protein